MNKHFLLTHIQFLSEQLLYLFFSKIFLALFKFVKRIFIDIFHIKIIISLMKTKNIPPDIKSKSINEAKIEISDILKRLEDNENRFREFKERL